MMAAKKEQAEAVQAPVSEVEVEGAQPGSAMPSNWEFVDRTPTRPQVAELLMTLPPVWGVETLPFMDYVQALPQKKKIQRPHPTRDDLKVNEYVESYSLYMSVGGRQQMLRQAQEAHGWRVDYRPEPVTPTGVPGYLSFSGKLVYRVYVDIYAPIGPGLTFKDEVDPTVVHAHEWMLIGTRSGTAWVPESGGSNAAASNPYEKVETSALGRAIGAWGFGVMPGSGIATVEEMAAIEGNLQYQSRERGSGADGEGRRESREGLIELTLSTIEMYRQAAGLDDDEVTQKIVEYLTKKLGISGAVYDRVKSSIDWRLVKDGQLVMLRSMMQDGIRRVQAAAELGA